MPTHREYAFQFNLNAIARVRAETEADARDHLNKIEMINPSELEIPGLEGRLTEFSIAEDPQHAELFEVDGDEPCRECGEPNPDGGDGWNGYCPSCADRASIVLDAEEAGWEFKETPQGWYAERDEERTQVLADKVEVAVLADEARDIPSLSGIAKPDCILLCRGRKVILVHGCFWHGHDCARRARVPNENRDSWLAKIERNRRRDAANLDALRSRRWHALVLWECELKDDAALRERLIQFLGPQPSRPAAS